MNTITNKFSLARLAGVLKCDLMENGVRYLGVLFILFLADLVYQIADIKDVAELSMLRALPVDGYMHQLAMDCVPFFYGILSLSLVCAAADMTAVPFKTKGRAMSYLMMPATKLEKFLSRAFINTIMLIVMAYVALFLADLGRMLYASVATIEGFYGFTLPTVWSSLFEPLREAYESAGVGYVIVNGVEVRPEWEMSMGIMAVATIVLSALYFHSLFLLGGCIWRKGALLKTMFVGIMIVFLFVWLIANSIPYLEPWFVHVFEPWVERSFESEKEFARIIFSIAIFMFTALTTLHWWIGYRLFTRKPMIPRTHLFGGKHLHQLFNKNK